MKRQGNWTDKRATVDERLASRFSIPGALTDSLGGRPELTTADFAAAVGAVSKPLWKILLCAKYGHFRIEQDQLFEIVLRRSWNRWREKNRVGNMDVKLNRRITELVMVDWAMPIDQRRAVADTYRAKRLGLGYQRFRHEIREHELDLVGWLDIETANALNEVSRWLRK